VSRAAGAHCERDCAMANQNPEKDEDNQRYIYRASITLKNGKKLYAKDCGKKAFKIPVKD